VTEMCRAAVDYGLTVSACKSFFVCGKLRVNCEGCKVRLEVSKKKRCTWADRHAAELLRYVLSGQRATQSPAMFPHFRSMSDRDIWRGIVGVPRGTPGLSDQGRAPPAVANGGKLCANLRGHCTRDFSARPAPSLTKVRNQICRDLS
jgi:hypothetical protein